MVEVVSKAKGFVATGSDDSKSGSRLLCRRCPCMGSSAVLYKSTPHTHLDELPLSIALRACASVIAVDGGRREALWSWIMVLKGTWHCPEAEERSAVQASADITWLCARGAESQRNDLNVYHVTRKFVDYLTSASNSTRKLVIADFIEHVTFLITMRTM